MNLSKFQFGYEKHGIIGFINVLLGKLGFKYRLENQLKKLIIWHGKNIEKISKNKIINGNYKDVKIQLNKTGEMMMSHLSILDYMNWKFKNAL
jgi:hypothetical protein